MKPNLKVPASYQQKLQSPNSKLQRNSRFQASSRLSAPLILALCMAMSVAAPGADAPTSDLKPVSPPDKQKVSYALGMNIGLLHKRSELTMQTDLPAFTKALKDTLDASPSELKESEIKQVLERAGSEGLVGQSETEKRKVGYALGMRMGLQIKARYEDADGAVVVQGFKDVLDGKQTPIDQTEITSLLQQAMAWGNLKQSEKNKAEGQAFLAKNLKEPGIKTLPDGLQYKVIQEGTGELPSTNNQVYIKMRGTFVDGRQFIKHNHYLIRCGGGCQGWQDALPRMRIGSKWQIFIPPDLGFGEQGEPGWGIGPNATLVFDLQMVSIAPPDAEFGRGRLGHAFEDSDVPDDPSGNASGAQGQTNSAQAASITGPSAK